MLVLLLQRFISQLSSQDDAESISRSCLPTSSLHLMHTTVSQLLTFMVQAFVLSLEALPLTIFSLLHCLLPHRFKRLRATSCLEQKFMLEVQLFSSNDGNYFTRIILQWPCLGFLITSAAILFMLLFDSCVQIDTQSMPIKIRW